MRKRGVESNVKRYLIGFLWLAIGLACLPVFSVIYNILPDQSPTSSGGGSPRTITIQLYAIQSPSTSWFPTDPSMLTVSFNSTKITIYDRGYFLAEWSISGTTLQLYVARPYQSSYTKITNGTWTYAISSGTPGPYNSAGYVCDSATGRCELYTWTVPSGFSFNADMIVVSVLCAVDSSYNTTRVFSSSGSLGSTGVSSKGIMGIILFAVPVVFFIQGARRLLWTRL